MGYRLVSYWVYGGFLASLILIALVPWLRVIVSPALMAIYLMTPVYMLHQYEEHDDDQFRKFMNTQLGQGREVLSPLAVFLINVPGVWGVNVIALYLAWQYNIGLGLIAAYLMLINAIVHIVAGLVLRRYNPGLITSVLLFLPFSFYCIQRINRVNGPHLTYHLIGLGTAVLIHGLIMLHVKKTRARYQK